VRGSPRCKVACKWVRVGVQSGLQGVFVSVYVMWLWVKVCKGVGECECTIGCAEDTLGGLTFVVL
jgi:hypothetical protein